MGSVIGPFWSYAQLEWLWIHEGGRAAAASVAAAVAEAESGGGQNSVNQNTNGSTDRGLWQINSVHASQSTFDPYANARAAIAISGNGSSWSAWSTYNSGLVHPIAGIAPASGPPSGSGAPGPPAVASGSGTAASGVDLSPVQDAIQHSSAGDAMGPPTVKAAARAHHGYVVSHDTWYRIKGLQLFDKHGGR